MICFFFLSSIMLPLSPYGNCNNPVRIISQIVFIYYWIMPQQRSRIYMNPKLYHHPTSCSPSIRSYKTIAKLLPILPDDISYSTCISSSISCSTSLFGSKTKISSTRKPPHFFFISRALNIIYYSAMSFFLHTANPVNMRVPGNALPEHLKIR